MFAWRAARQSRRRRAFFAPLEHAGSVLEIGPLADPSLRGPNVRYFDVLPTDALRAKAQANGMDPASCPHIDYVSPTGDLAVVDATFDAVVSSHTIEHQPDLLRHLHGVARLLVPHGRYYLAVPDQRYCFDHFIAPSNIAEVLDAHLRDAAVHSAAHVIEHLALTTHNDPVRHWRGDHGAPAWIDEPGLLREAVAQFNASAGTYLDAHAWQFTPQSFAQIMRALAALELSAFDLLSVQPTRRNAFEFYAVLEKRRERTATLDRLPAGFEPAAYLAANPDVAAAGVDAARHYLEFGRNEGRRLRP